MNRIMREYYPMFEQYQALRNQLMAQLSDADLGFRPPGDNPTLGALCREIGDVEESYIRSFQTAVLELGRRNDTPGLEQSVALLTDWYGHLDAELKETIAGLSDSDLDGLVIDRGGFTLPAAIQLDVYKEALLIFYGKVSVYMKAMGRPVTRQWQDWIG